MKFVLFVEQQKKKEYCIITAADVWLEMIVKRLNDYKTKTCLYYVEKCVHKFVITNSLSVVHQIHFDLMKWWRFLQDDYTGDYPLD